VAEAFLHLRLDLWLLAVGVLGVTQLLSSLRWQIIARPLGFERPLRQLTGFYFIGMYFNLLLPTSVGGDVVRACYLDGRSGRRLAAFFAVFLDRLSGLLMLLALACLAACLCPLDLPAWVRWGVWGTAAGVLVGIAALPLLASQSEKGARKVQRLREAVRTVSCPRVLLSTSALSLTVQCSNVLIVWLIGQAIHANVPGSYYWIIVPMVSLLTLLPISVNGMGVREGGMALFLAPLGVGNEIAVTLAFVWFLVQTVVSLGGGLVYLFGRFPRPANGPLEMEQVDGPLGGHSDQGRERQPRAAA
jgi:hypothetical protein